MILTKLREWRAACAEAWATWYLRHHDNWHKHPWVSRVCCWIGRHDYEIDSIVPDQTGAKLQCFYCGQIRYSSFIRRG